MEKLLTIWPSVAALATDLGLSYPTVHSWTHRGVPRKRYRQIIQAAASRGAKVSADDLLGDDVAEDAA